MKQVLWFVWLLPRNVMIGFMKVYRKVVSPLYGEVCRYYPSCSRYALESYQHNGLVRATGLTGWRLLRCNPWSAGGVDDPPQQNQPQLVLNRYGFVVWRAHASYTCDERRKHKHGLH